MSLEQKAPRTYEIREVQNMTKYAESTIRHGLSEGRWTYYKVGRRTLVDADEIDAMILAGRRPAVATE